MVFFIKVFVKGWWLESSFTASSRGEDLSASIPPSVLACSLDMTRTVSVGLFNFRETVFRLTSTIVRIIGDHLPGRRQPLDPPKRLE